MSMTAWTRPRIFCRDFALFALRGLTAAALAISLPLAAPAQSHDSTLLFRDVDVFDGSRMIRHTAVLVRDGMIRAVGVADKEIPSSATVIDGKGKTLLPGLFDAHTHLGQY